MTRIHRYDAIIRWVFERNHEPGRSRVPFRREDIGEAARALGVPIPKNLGDVVYAYRSRRALPDEIEQLAPAGKSWVILGTGPGACAFVAKRPLVISPTRGLARTRIPNATPELVAMYALSDEQAMLAKLRFDRLVDIFTRVTCYPLQSHLRTTVRGVQIETDDLYVGIDRAGAHHVFPIQAKQAVEKVPRAPARREAPPGRGLPPRESGRNGSRKRFGFRGEHAPHPPGRRGSPSLRGRIPLRGALSTGCKGEKDRLAPSQIEQDMDMCAEKFPGLVCRPIGAQFGDGGTIALFEFDRQDGEVVVWRERQYVLVPGADLTAAELARYRTRGRAELEEDR